MAKRSDFAQKLLDDLRLRKERIAASQNSNRSKTTTIDAYAYSKQIQRGSKNTRTHGTGVPKTTNTKYGGGNKTLKIEDNSNQIVPYNRSRNSEQIGDLSMALAFALENGGKLRRNNNSSGNSLMLGFLHQISRGSFDIGKMNKRNGLDRLHGSSGYFPTISHLHIKEISKGAQKLNQILRTCSNGLNFGKCSIEIGQELLKGAMDLEESLRMLVNLHEASEHMISPQQKNRIVLLEDEDVEENEVETPDQKQIYQPQFFLDKFSLNSRSNREIKGNGLDQKLATLRYTAERGNFNHEEQTMTTIKLSSHRRSASYGHDVKTSSSPREKVGISNVIAKLMGLDNLTNNSNSTHLDSGFKQKVAQKEKDMQSTARGSTRKAEPKTIIKGQINPKNSRLTESDKNSAVVNPTFVSQGMNKFPINDASLQAARISGKPSWKVDEGIRPKTSPSTIPIFKQQQNKDETRQRVTNQIDYQKGIVKQLPLNHREPTTGRDENRGVLKSGVQQKDYLEGNAKQHHLKQREPKATEWNEKRGLVLKNGMQKMDAQMHKKSERAIILEGDKERTLELEKGYSNRLQSRRQQKIPSSPGYQQPLRKAAVGEIKHHGDEKKQKSGKQKVQERNQKGSVMTSKILTKPAHEALTLSKQQQDTNHVRQSEKGYKETIVAHQSNMPPNNGCPEDLLRENVSYDRNDKPNDITYKSKEQNSSSKDSGTKYGKEDLLIQPVLKKQHANLPAKNDVGSTRKQEFEGPKSINEVFPKKQKTPMFQEVDQNRHEKFDVFAGPELLEADGPKEVEAHITQLKKTVASVQPLNSTEDPHSETKQEVASSGPAADVSDTLRKPQISAPNDSCEKTTVISSSNQEDWISIFGRGEVNSFKTVPKAIDGKYNMDVFYPQHLEHLHNFSKSRKRETLTESENRLKQRLMTSERFLNAAEALFKLNIPSFILHDSGHIHLKNGSNLITDCSYEVMKRKAIRQELNNHPCKNISMRSKKIESLDDLIMQLHKDFEALKFYGRKGNIECELHEYLPKMLEIDICNQEPDLNSMWDIGWNDNQFAFLEREEVVREVEKRILNGLLDEVFRDLLHV